MSEYYSGRRARHYNRRWRRYTGKTLAVAIAMIDFSALQRVPEELGHPPRVLDVACGTGILLRHLLERVPGMEAYGVDASADMLAQAQEALKDQPRSGQCLSGWRGPLKCGGNISIAVGASGGWRRTRATIISSTLVSNLVHIGRIMRQRFL